MGLGKNIVPKQNSSHKGIILKFTNVAKVV
jgi:hypothetical protein